MKLYSNLKVSSLLLFAAGTIFLNACGDNPDKEVDGINGKYDFMSTVGDSYYYSQSGDAYKFSDDKISIQSTRDLEIKFYKSGGSVQVSFYPSIDSYRFTIPYDLFSDEYSGKMIVACQYSYEGNLGRIRKVPDQKYQKMFSWDLKSKLEEDPRLQFMIEASLSGVASEKKHWIKDKSKLSQQGQENIESKVGDEFLSNACAQAEKEFFYWMKYLDGNVSQDLDLWVRRVSPEQMIVSKANRNGHEIIKNNSALQNISQSIFMTELNGNQSLEEVFWDEMPNNFVRGTYDAFGNNSKIVPHLDRKVALRLIKEDKELFLDYQKDSSTCLLTAKYQMGDISLENFYKEHSNYRVLLPLKYLDVSVKEGSGCKRPDVSTVSGASYISIKYENAGNSRSVKYWQLGINLLNERSLSILEEQNIYGSRQ